MVKVDLLTYNNFYNNIAKKAGGLNTNYSAFKQYGPFTIDFNPNDGVDTEIVLNIDEVNNVDYLIVYTATATSAVPAGTILSRWFILEKKRLRGGQCSFKLHRDVIVDNITDIKTSTALVERATLLDNDPFIFNKEDSSYNQIKISEEPLKDSTNTSWIVGYLANDGELDDKEVVYSPDISQYYRSYSTWDDFPFIDNTRLTAAQYGSDHPETPFVTARKPALFVSAYKSGVNREVIVFSGDTSIPVFYRGNKTYSPLPYTPCRYEEVTTPTNNQLTRMASGLRDNRNNSHKNVFDLIEENWQFTPVNPVTVTNFNTFKNKTIKVGSKYYKLIPHATYNNCYTDLTSNTASGLVLGNGAIKAEVNSLSDFVLTSVQYSDSPVTPVFRLWNDPSEPVEYTSLDNNNYFTVEEVYGTDTYKFTIPGQRNKLKDAPYTMFAMPYNDLAFKILNFNYTSLGDICRNIASTMATQLGGTGTSFIYDLQILPYCPLQGRMSGGKFIIQGGSGLAPLVQNQDYSTITHYVDGVGSGFIGFILWLQESSFSLTIDRPINVQSVKISNETDLYRICSPNYQGTFDFSAAKNRGVSGFDVDCTYRPYTPYIKIAPIWNQNGIYGGTNDDARGCICGGDFSLPIVDDAWIDYQITNKNFLNIFDRQIKSMDTMRGYQRTEQILGSIFGGVGGTASATAAGALIRGPVGGVVGGVVGAVGNIGAAIGDYYISESRFKETKSLTTDMFNYQLGNVQALPDSLAKVGCQTSNFRYWPMLEYYSCTDEEKENLDYILKTQGMKVGKVGTLNSYFDTAQRFTYENNKQFIRGRIIKSNISDDTHMLMAVNNQLSAGVYFDKGLM